MSPWLLPASLPAGVEIQVRALPARPGTHAGEKGARSAGSHVLWGQGGLAPHAAGTACCGAGAGWPCTLPSCVARDSSGSVGAAAMGLATHAATMFGQELGWECRSGTLGRGRAGVAHPHHMQLQGLQGSHPQTHPHPSTAPTHSLPHPTHRTHTPPHTYPLPNHTPPYMHPLIPHTQYMSKTVF